MKLIALPYATIYDDDVAGNVYVNPELVISVAPKRSNGMYDSSVTNLRLADGSWFYIALPPEEVTERLLRCSAYIAAEAGGSHGG